MMGGFKVTLFSRTGGKDRQHQGVIGDLDKPASGCEGKETLIGEGEYVENVGKNGGGFNRRVCTFYISSIFRAHFSIWNM